MPGPGKSLLTEQIEAQKKSGEWKPHVETKTTQAAPKEASYSMYDTKPGAKTYGLGSCVDRYSGKSSEAVAQ
jgi:hypothetical protein